MTYTVLDITHTNASQTSSCTFADGDPGGNCIQTSSNQCTDSHSICVNGTCQCNEFRHYIIENGECVRDGG